MKFQNRSQKKVLFLKRIINKHEKSECIKMFIEKFKCHRATAYDWYHMIKTNTKSGHQLNSKRYKYEKLKNCYFCNKKATHRHHIKYEIEITIPLCDSCHRKIHFIIKTAKKTE